jgi:hypothetical protein
MTTVAAPVNPYGYATEGTPVPLLEPDKPSVGPVTQAIFRRFTAIAGAVLLAAVAAAWLAPEDWQRTFALGVMFPGGGFLAHLTGGAGDITAHLLLFLLAVVLFVLSLLLWVATGNFFGVPASWLATAAWAAAMGGGHHAVWQGARILVPALTLAAVAAIALWVARLHSAAAARRPQVNRALAAARPRTAVTALGASQLPVVGEMTPDSLARQRFLLDRALQPVESFEGFDHIDQFREAATRYQLSLSSYALSAQTYAHTPAFRGYMAEAQHRLGLKMQDHRAWGYWRIENFWGRLHLNPDPVAKNNDIMWTGYYAAMLGMLAETTGDHSFEQPGSILLRHPRGKTFAYDFPGLCDNLLSNYTASRLTLFPCEPGWSYPICNDFGAIGLITHDRIYGTDYWARIEARLRRALEDEFTLADGQIVSIRHSFTGISVSLLNSTMPGCLAALYMNAVFPDLARRSYQLVRDKYLKIAGSDILIALNGWDLIDFGNYRPSKLSSYAMIAAAAREHGDDEVADRILAKVEATYPMQTVHGVGHYPATSVGAHSVIHHAYTGRANVLHDVVRVGLPEPWRNGPLLAEATYPDVLVAKAVSDGDALDLVLYPGRPEGLRSTVGLSQLRPNSRYTVTGAVDRELVADGNGTARVEIDLPGRTRVQLLPAGI